VGGEASVAYRADTSRLSPHASIGLAYMNVGFQVNALTFGMVDHTHYLSSGMVISVSGGLSYRLTDRLILSTDIFYSPLSVKRGFGVLILLLAGYYGLLGTRLLMNRMTSPSGEEHLVVCENKATCFKDVKTNYVVIVDSDNIFNISFNIKTSTVKYKL
jgi:hypothetical protein